MPPEGEKFDPEAPDAREVGSEAVDETASLGSLVGQLYRGEVDREVNWRQRLDSTTNWAVTLIAAILAYAFANQDVAHTIILVGMAIGVVFLLIEARRFQRYDVWRSRVRSIQENFFANALDPTAGVERRDWRRQLSEDYRNPSTKTSYRRAVVHRLRHVYLPLLGGLVIVWLFRLNGADWPLVPAAAVSNVPGWVVVSVVIAGYAVLVTIAVWPGEGAPSETSESRDLGDLDRGG